MTLLFVWSKYILKKKPITDVKSFVVCFLCDTARRERQLAQTLLDPPHIYITTVIFVSEVLQTEN